MRLFVAIEVPPAIKEALAAASRELARLPAEGSWPKSANLHLTLKFLGETEEARRSEVHRAMREAAATCPPFRLTLCGLGAFPNTRRPRVVWAGLGGEVEIVQRLQADLEARLEAAGFPREERAFKPHLTLARLRSVADPAHFAAGVAAYTLPELPFEVGRIVLFRSELHPAGSRYTELAAAALSAS
jgi:2'-5' RNA ligase